MDDQRSHFPSDEPFGVIVTTEFPLPPISGGRKRAARLLDAMLEAGVVPHVLTIGAVTDEAHAEAHARGWRVEVMPSPQRSGRLRRHLRWEISPWSPHVIRRIRELSATAAFVQLEEIGMAQYAGQVPRRTPLVASLHNVDSKARGLTSATKARAERARTAYRRSRMAAVERACVRRATATLAVSEADVAHFRATGGSRVLLVPNGVDADLFDVPIREVETKDVLFFGQLAYRPNLEGIMRFIRRSWPAVVARHPDARLRIAGPFAPPALQELAEAAPSVDLVGFVPDLAGELAASRAIVVPIWSGGGTRIKVLEALAAGRPVVGTSLGVEQIGFVDGLHGRIADSDEGLAGELCAELESPADAMEHSRRGRELARRYDWRQATEAARRLYHELAFGGPPATSAAPLEAASVRAA